MARRRFFVPDIRRGMAELSGPDAEHLVRVLRVEPGERYEISDNAGVHLAEVQSARKSLVSFKILEPIAPRELALKLTLAVALFKFDRFEWLIEKATELGVSSVCPVESVRSEKGLFQASAKRLSRWQRIALEASQQSRRDHLPVIQPALRFKQALQLAASTRLMLDEDEAATPILNSLPGNRSPQDEVALLLGPEGGWTEEELQQIIAAGWQPCSLGSTILRAETAGMAGLAVLNAAWSGAQA